ncbi:putative OmpA domain protein transmembrane region-containing protein [Sterolibacterium denitrificans]|uniref:OmpA domain protein transmembrane region-containing protein n=2 Tax=Sterolibacterium denitrificans TaxID=157592 RepID=A0A7Z7HU50_9PROT|nr:putative OmpA domain protein transmembrane region-containing protein [Sterolibacterium denitrificans]
MKRHLARLTCVAGAYLCVVSPAAHALEMAGSMYLVAAYGTTRVADQPMIDSVDNIVRSSLKNVSKIDSTVSSSDHGYKLQLGYEFTPHFAIEGGYVDLGRLTYKTSYETLTPSPFPDVLGDITTTFDPAHRQARVKGWNIAGVGIYPIDEEWSVFGKLGIIHARMQTLDTSERLPFNIKHNPFGSTRNGAESKWSSNIGIGASYRISDTLGIRAEAERFGKVGKREVTGSTDIDLVTLGLTARF